MSGQPKPPLMGLGKGKCPEIRGKRSWWSEPRTTHW